MQTQLRTQHTGRQLDPLCIVVILTLLAACATSTHRVPQQTLEANTAPEWLSYELGCDREAMDYRWNYERYWPIADTDSACVALGRWGQPSYSGNSHFFSIGPEHADEYAREQLSWRAATPSGELRINVYKSSTPAFSQPTSDYYKIERPDPNAPKVVTDTSHTGVIVGSVFDTAGHTFPRPISICTRLYDATTRRTNALGCTQTSAGGSFRLHGLPIGDVMLQATCDTPSLLGQGSTLSAGAHAARKPGTIVMLLNTKGCDMRPLRTISRVFRGHWHNGFEENNFTPCPADSWRLDSDTTGRGKAIPFGGAWVDSLPEQGTKQWPKRLNGMDKNGRGGYVSYVQWRATVTGPRHYGHMGVSQFSMKVDSVMVMRKSSPKDCH